MTKFKLSNYWIYVNVICKYRGFVVLVDLKYLEKKVSDVQ